MLLFRTALRYKSFGSRSFARAMNQGPLQVVYPFPEYDTPPMPSRAQMSAANIAFQTHSFHQSTKFLETLDDINYKHLCEFALIGRSNVGKSTLLNSLMESKLAITSKTPGRTRGLNYYNINDSFFVVDLPGYGASRVPSKMVKEFHATIRDYLSIRTQGVLARTFVLIDARRGITSIDKEMLDILDEMATKYSVVLTKCDLIKPAMLTQLLQRVHHDIEFRNKRPSAAHPAIFCTSSKQGWGITEVRSEMYVLGMDKLHDRDTLRKKNLLPKGRFPGTAVGTQEF